MQLRVIPREGGAKRRDWVPRLRASNEAGGDITALWEGAVVIRRELFERVGGWDEPMRMVHEGVDLAWRVMDAGYRVRYEADAAVLHPSNVADRYPHFYGARNRVWIARRYLPWPLAGLYVASFMARTAPRLRSRTALRDTLRGYRAGLREPAGERRPLRGRTLVRMTRAGRPPIL
jgi:GT2 family glycosyltransferase